MKTKHLKKRTISWLAYRQQTEQQLHRLTCGLLSGADLDYAWRHAWRRHIPPARAVEMALAAEGFLVERLPTPFVIWLAGQRHKRQEGSR